MPDDAKPKKKTGRSPGFPSIDLETALKKAAKLYELEKQNSAHYSTIIKHWDYSPKSSPGRLAFAAVKQFGLIEVEGAGATRSARVTDAAKRVILDDRPDSHERAEAIKALALKPKKHREIWNYYKGVLPSDTELLFRLKADWNFTETGAEDFLTQFKSTLSFAKVTASDTLPEDDDADDEEADDDEVDDNDAHRKRSVERHNTASRRGAVVTPKPPGSGNMAVMAQLQLWNGGNIVVEVPLPPQPGDLQRLARLEAMLMKEFADFLKPNTSDEPDDG